MNAMRESFLEPPCASLLDYQGSVLPVGPLSHGAVVIFCIGVAEQSEDEHAVRRTDAALSIGIHFLVGGYAIIRQ